ncbi:MAG: hypothetical protein ABIL12_02115 [candidate division WOR-3 bacterium]
MVCALGLVPLTNNTPADMMSPCKETVKVKTYFGVDDHLISICTANCTIIPMTMEVQCK